MLFVESNIGWGGKERRPISCRLSAFVARVAALPLFFLLGAAEEMPSPKGPTAPGCPRLWTETLERGQAVIVGWVGTAKVKEPALKVTRFISPVKTLKIIRARGLNVPGNFNLEQHLTDWEPTGDSLGHIIQDDRAILLVTAIPGEKEFFRIEGSECKPN
ncbi:MAG TPA: hypothetical protein VJM78_06250 [Rhizomicrobium sp.]|nr:hypothetical protein [Rhizomicrobium sp.]